MLLRAVRGDRPALGPSRGCGPGDAAHLRGPGPRIRWAGHGPHLALPQPAQEAGTGVRIGAAHSGDGGDRRARGGPLRC